MAISLGGNKSKSSSSATMDQDVWGPQAQHMGQMYGNLNNLWNMGMPMMNLGMPMMGYSMPYMSGAANMGQVGAQNQIGGGATGGQEQFGQFREDLYGSIVDSMNSPSAMGQMYEDIVGGPGNTYIDPMVDAMQADTQRMIDQNRASNALEAQAMGQGGGSRHALENAVMSSEAMRNLGDATTALRGQAYDTDLNWKMNIARQADLARGQAQDRGLELLGQRDANQQFGLNYMPTQQNLGMGIMAPWMQASMMPWQVGNMYAGAFGDPTVLTSGTQTSKGKGSGFGFSAGGFS